MPTIAGALRAVARRLPHGELDQAEPTWTRRRPRVLGAVAAFAFALAACGGDDDAADSAAATEPAVTDDAEAPEPTDETGGAAAGGWTVDTDDCVDPDRANAPIDGTVKIGSAAPLSGGPAAAAFAPVIAGTQAYIDYANEQGLLPDHQIELSYGDDQFDPSLTPDVINGALDDGAHLISGIIGAAHNASCATRSTRSASRICSPPPPSRRWTIRSTTRGRSARSCRSTSRPRPTPRTSPATSQTGPPRRCTTSTTTPVQRSGDPRGGRQRVWHRDRRRAERRSGGYETAPPAS